MSEGREFTEVEQPFIDQLVGMGWTHITGDVDDPGVTGRERFRDVLLTDDLTQALRRINRDPDGQPWLDPERCTQAITDLQRLGTARLMEANQKATELLLKGTVVDGVEGWEQGRGRTVHFIDWDQPDNNTFRVINQFQVACPAGQAQAHIRPDVVLFVNGIPLVVVEAKAPDVANPMEEAVNQLQRYANRRQALGVVDVREGNEQLFHYAQFVVATCGEEARAATFSALAVHFMEWKDTSPVDRAEVAAVLGKDPAALSSQEVLVAGMLRPANLLDIVRHFTLFMESDGRTVKIVCRYQQFRAVQRAVQRMLTGQTRAQDGEQDRRGGIIWHTQGSGKSLTMVFLIRKMRSHPDLRQFKVVVVTDRHTLQQQLAETAAMTDEVLTVVKPETRGAISASSYDVLKETLARKGSELVFAMIQKYRGEVLDPDAGIDEDDDARPPVQSRPLPELNDDEHILVLVDEAHRSHTNTAHANLMKALPNCVKIGFTGTPIIMRAKGATTRIFGDFIDRYTLRESEAEGVTVPILYEGRTARSVVAGAESMDQLFEDMFVERTPEELQAIKQKYATTGEVMEAEALIAAKARNMLRHYVEHILPNGFKAQVVAVSRRATIRYHEAFCAAQAELVTALRTLDVEKDSASGEAAFLRRAHRFLPTIAALDFAPVISGGHNDTVDPEGKWSSRTKIDARIAKFKQPLFAQGPNTFDEDKANPLAFLIVKSMLLTGFDAPVEQVLYLDRPMREAELLQAIARVNRTYARGGVEKEAGLVVDYYGVSQHLKEALEAYSEEDIEGALQSWKDELPKLTQRHQQALAVFTARGIRNIADTEACVGLLKDEKIRAEFHVKLKQFLVTLDLLLPRPEALPFVNDAKTLSYIQARARNRYRDRRPLIGLEVGVKVRKLIDDHVMAEGIDVQIPPIAMSSPDFSEHVETQGSPRAKASEMEHALRAFIRDHFNEDPVRFQKLSERLEEILERLEERWEQLLQELEGLRAQALEGGGPEGPGDLDSQTQLPFFALLRRERFGDEAPADHELEVLRVLTVDLVERIRGELDLVDFWARAEAQEQLRQRIIQILDDADYLPFDRIGRMADRLMELAQANHSRLVR